MRKHFKLAFDCDNAAFAGGGEPQFSPDIWPPDQIVRILRDVAERVRQGSHAGRIRDINGNLVGQWEWRG